MGKVLKVAADTGGGEARPVQAMDKAARLGSDLMEMQTYDILVCEDCPCLVHGQLKPAKSIEERVGSLVYE